MHVVFAFAAPSLFGPGEVGEEVGPQVEEEEVTRGLLAHRSAAVETLRIVNRGGMIMAVPRVDGKAFEFRNGSEGIVRRVRHQRGQSGVDRSEVVETALALNRLEKEIDGDVRSAAIPVTLEEVAAGARVAHAAENTGGEIGFVGNPMAKEAGFRPCESIAGGLEKAAENG
ncbi:MAG: hypothetical protein HUU04_11045 [Verrucomicrobiae bacterium]|nr:hypothetical protein [Verrucomicrobiae bacterium]